MEKLPKKKEVKMHRIKNTLFQFVAPFTLAQIITLGIVMGMMYLWLR